MPREERRGGDIVEEEGREGKERRGQHGRGKSEKRPGEERRREWG